MENLASASPVSASPVICSSSRSAWRSPGQWSVSCCHGTATTAGAKAQSASALNGIVLLFSVIPGVGYLITAGVVRLLKVDRTLMRQIQSDLEKRRSNYSELNEYQELKTSEHVRKA